MLFGGSSRLRFPADALPQGVHRSDHIVVTAVGVMLSSFALLLLPEEAERTRGTRDVGGRGKGRRLQRGSKRSKKQEARRAGGIKLFFFWFCFSIYWCRAKSLFNCAVPPKNRTDASESIRRTCYVLSVLEILEHILCTKDEENLDTTWSLPLESYCNLD